MKFSHIDDQRKPAMVDVSGKEATERRAVAECYVNLGAEVMEQLSDARWSSPKGPVFETAIIAGTLAAKKTAELIPFCHPLPLKHVKIDIEPFDDSRLRILAEAKVDDRTGVEMEALTAANVAALAIYDMCKSASPDIVIENCRLVAKTGGKADYQR